MSLSKILKLTKQTGCISRLENSPGEFCKCFLTRINLRTIDFYSETINLTLSYKTFVCFCCAPQAEIESRVELERRLKQAEEALQDLEKGLNSLERTKERDEKMKGDVTHLRSEFLH